MDAAQETSQQTPFSTVSPIFHAGQTTDGVPPSSFR